MNVTLTRVTDRPIDAIEEAACNCYNSKPSDGKIMNACYRSGHHSVLEFANFTFHIEGVSRALLAQLTRHRHAGYAVRSQRYCDEKEFNYVVPPSIKKDERAYHTYSALMGYINMQYKELQSMGISNEDARMILPNACYTTLEFTCNGRELIHIMNERLCTRAQWEIRELCIKMKKAIEEYDEQCAKFSKFLVPKCEALGLCIEHNCCGRAPQKNEVMAIYKTAKELERIRDFSKNDQISFDSVTKSFNKLFS